MKTTILSLVLASIAGLMYCSEDSLAVTQEPEDKELRALLTKRRGALKDYFEAVSERMQVSLELDSCAIGRLTEARQLLLTVELELARSKEERIALLEQALADMLKVKNRFSVRQESPDAILFLESDCLSLEIELHKARKAP